MRSPSYARTNWRSARAAGGAGHVRLGRGVRARVVFEAWGGPCAGRPCGRRAGLPTGGRIAARTVGSMRGAWARAGTAKPACWRNARWVDAKTKAIKASIDTYLASRASGDQRAGCEALMALMGEITGETPRMGGEHRRVWRLPVRLRERQNGGVVPDRLCDPRQGPGRLSRRRRGPGGAAHQAGQAQGGQVVPVLQTPRRSGRSGLEEAHRSLGGRASAPLSGDVGLIPRLRLCSHKTGLERLHIQTTAKAFSRIAENMNTVCAASLR